ncbi:MAG: metallophosphoesterase [Anaerolineales bacterium]|nr:metallophosphoesterase [Anaerolineales bacterium]
MMEPKQSVYFVHISDTHIGPTPEYERHGHRSLPCAQRIVEIINRFPVKPDFVVHTGDVVTEPNGRSYQLAAETFSHLDVPIYYVTGNHDTARDIQQFLPMGPHQPFCQSAAEQYSYTFTVKGYRFLVLDARAPDELDPHGLLSQAQLDWVRREATADGPPLTLFMHFPTLPMNSTWMDAYMLVINGPELHQALLPARNRLRGVFYGHIHQNMQVIRDGILYASTASVFSQFSAWPGHASVGYDPDHLPGYSFVHLLPEQTIIHQHTFPRP